jgi:hypothetical protein
MTVSKKTARIAGLLYLIIIVAGISAEFFVRQSLIVTTDPAATAANVSGAESLFRMGIAGDLVMIIADIGLALAFFVLLRPVSTAIALLAAFFRLVQASVLGLNLLNLFIALQYLTGAAYLSAFTVEQQNAQGLLFLRAHSMGYTLAMIFFGVQCLVLGYLVYRSGYFPKVLGALMLIAGTGYLTDSFASILLPNYATYEAMLLIIGFVPAFVGELAMCLYLLVKGVNLPGRNRDTSSPAADAEAVAI